MQLPEVDRIMAEIVRLRQADAIPDRILFLSYTPCLAVGARELNEADLLQPLEMFQKQGIPLFKSTRGGGLTYHWPGQLIVYPILKLQKHEQNIPQHMFRLEEVGLQTLRDFGVNAKRKRDATAQIGLWHARRKVASMGIFITRWVTSYGFALNLGGDFSPARAIRPCGLEGVQLTSIEEITGTAPYRGNVITSVQNHFQDVFQRQVLPTQNVENLNKLQLNEADL